ncbi:MAG TPA: hypothetical protein VEA80_00025 [Vitreimonas sp.]|uniref:hypothetical protein n=1 Tax=Vitreimonas sp. TaxID=3069702 RepID=UPI002D3F98FD|nr:hypothetical protein [Vitreimonas sp.]HYD85839.1 hypothetical protein [Vitreimonas sp.]
MQELAWLLEPIRIWLEGGTWAEIKASHGFRSLAVLAAILLPSTLIVLGIGGMSDWRSTPLARWLGVAQEDPDTGWAENARDLDKDGTPDF